MRAQFKKPRKSKKTVSKKVAAAPATRAGEVALIKKVIKGQAETKRAVWYGGSTATGLYADASAVVQNQFIVSNATDILRVLPAIQQGIDDWQRIGQSVIPVKCTLNCRVLISPVTSGSTGYTQGFSYNIRAVAYLLEHVSLKNYEALYARNSFNQLLQIGDGQTTFFGGTYYASKLPVETGYYKVHKKKVMTLRSSGTANSGGSSVTPLYQGSNNNSAPFVHEWTWDVKGLPKKLMFPESTATTAVNDPTNSAPFWCIGYYMMDGTGTPTSPPSVTIQQQYMSALTYKDF